MRKLILPIAALAISLGALAASVAVASASVPADQAPECVHITVQSAQSNGTTRSLHLEFCGSGAGADSALHDYVNGRVFILDGGGMPGRACGGRADPCVIFPR